MTDKKIEQNKSIPEFFSLGQEHGWKIELSSMRYSVKELSKIAEKIMIKESKPIIKKGNYPQ